MQGLLRWDDGRAMRAGKEMLFWRTDVADEADLAREGKSRAMRRVRAKLAAGDAYMLP